MKTLLISLLAACALLLGATAASGSTRPAGTSPRGIIPHLAAASPARTLSLVHAACTNDTNCSGYEGAIDQYFTDVAADSGTSTNVYSTDTQYFDATGHIAYSSTFGGSYVDTSPFPANGCDDTFHSRHDSVCLTDSQLQTEIQNAITAKGWPDGENSLFFIMLPSGVGVCFSGAAPGSGGQCTTNTFCAYHNGFIGLDSNPIVYAVEPYDATISGCTDGNSPNGNDADATINAISHEHNEAITDPWGTAWTDTSGDEVADICVGQFGTPLGSTANGTYNQVINGHDYWLQTEYSNDGHTCVQRYPTLTGFDPLGGGGPLSLQIPGCDPSLSACWVMRTNTTYTIYWTPSAVTAPVNSVLPTVTGKAVVGKTLSSSTGTWTESPASYAYQWLRCSASGTSCSSIAGAQAATYKAAKADAGHTLEARVSATNPGGTTSAVSAPTAVVTDVPHATHKPHILGKAKVGTRLSITSDAWTGSPFMFLHQWLRCSAKGTACVRIPGAKGTSYKLTPRDAGHRLRVKVTAVNVAGRVSSTSAPTRAVHS